MDQPRPSRWLGRSEIPRDLKPRSQRLNRNDSHLVSSGKKSYLGIGKNGHPAPPTRVLSSFVTRHTTSRVGWAPASCCSVGPDSDLPWDASGSLTSAHFLLRFSLARVGSCFGWHARGPAPVFTSSWNVLSFSWAALPWASCASTWSCFSSAASSSHLICTGY